MAVARAAQLLNQFTLHDNVPDIKLLTKGDEKYEHYREGRVFARNPLNRHPAGIARPTSVEEVVAAVKYAKSKNLKVGIRSGGHCHNAPSVRDGAILIDLEDLNELRFEEKTKTLICSPSRTGRMIQEYLAPHNSWFPGGHCPDVALGGFLSQGGAGFMWRNVGWAASLIKWMDVVTADGTIIHCDQTENSDLLWSFIGAGHGYFAAVVRFGLKVLPISKCNLRSFYVFPGKLYRQVMKWSLDVADAVAPATEFYIIAVRRKKFMPDGDPDEMILRVQCASWAESEENAKAMLEWFEKCPYASEAYAHAYNEKVTFQDEYAVQDTISFKGTYIITNGWIEGDNAKQVDLLEDAFTTVPTYETNTIMYSCHPYGPGSKSHFANDISAGTYAFSYTIADDSDPDPEAARKKCAKWIEDVWGEIDRKSGEAERSGDPTAARTKGYYTGDANMESRQGRFMSEENWAKWIKIRNKYDPEKRFVGYLKNPKFTLNWNAWEGQPPADRPEY